MTLTLLLIRHATARPALEGEVVQVRQGLGERETPLVLCQGAAEHDPRDLVRGLRTVGDLSPHRLKPFLVVEHQLPYPTVKVVKDGAVAGEHEVCAEIAHAVQRL